LEIRNEVKIIQREYRIIGREDELAKARAAISRNKHILLEGPVGVGKTIIAVALSRHFGRNFYRVDGDERYTEHKLSGWFDPALVMAKGYTHEAFIPGPLTQAMRDGSFLFINELNRMPEGTQNVLLPAMDERQMIVPKIGVIESKPGFLIIATQNPEEFVGTSRLSEAIKDRFVWIRLEYQTETEERKIVEKETGCEDDYIIKTAVKIVRRTRTDPKIRRGASVRGAIDITELIRCLSENATLDMDLWIRIAIMALATRIELQDQAAHKMEDIIKDIATSVLKEYPHYKDKQVPSRFSSEVENEKEEHSASDLERVRVALNKGNLAGAVQMLQQNSQLLSEIFSDQDLFEKMLKAAECHEPRQSALELIFMIQGSLDAERKLMAKRIMNRIIVRTASQIAGKGIRPRVNVNVPFRPGLEEFNLEETLESRLGKGFVGCHDITCMERRPKKKAFSLILDASNSMQTRKIIIAALTVGTFAYKFSDDYYSVLTFRDHAELLKPIRDRSSIVTLIDKMLDLQTGGTTNIEEALQKGLEELEQIRELEGTGILITDGWVTKGGDPLRVAVKYPKLHVIQVPLGVGGGDPDMCRNLATAGRGRYSYVHDFSELPHAVLNIIN